MTSCVNYLPNGESNFLSLVDVLGNRAQAMPNQIAYIFLENGETESQSLTYSELDAKARAIAAHLQSMQGERALLLYPSGLEFITAFMGCLYAGVVAVPVYPPRRNQKLSRLLSIVNDAQACIALTTTSILADLEQRWASDASLAQLELVATDTIVADSQEFAPLSVTGSNLAFLQYTSGSTGTPKGVMVTHGNIIHNQQVIQLATGNTRDSIYVSWLPLFHDMGLGNALQSCFVGISYILMPPAAFLMKPIRWLKAISKYRATITGGPNFAYDLCVSKVNQESLEALDLSSLDVAANGAEPIKAETLEKFTKKFAYCGFRRSAFYPCYGIAEATLFVTGGDKNKQPVIQGVKAGDLEQNLVVESEIYSDESRSFVGVGSPYLDTTVIIVNPESLTPSEPGQVGEIWVSSGSVASGYWNRPEATKETFQAYLKDTGDGPFLRTGDLGFFSKGELFVTGRLKDLIIIRGRNHYPQDIELTVENSHPSLRSHGCAAFSVERDEEERLVVACEVERTYLRKLNTEEVVSAVRHGIWMEHELKVYGVLLLKTGSIPKTSSGKIQRHACRQDWLDKQLKLVGEWIENELVEAITSEQQSDESFESLTEKTTSFRPTQNNGHKVLTSQDTASQSRADELLEWLRDYASFRINSRLIDERRCIPPHIVLDFGNQGLLGLQVPKHYGGKGFNYCDTFRVFEQLGAIDLTLAAFVGVHHVLGTRPIMKYAKDSVRDELLPLIAEGRELAAFAITEPGAGSNPRAIATTALPDHRGGWRLKGQKIWIGTGSWASVTNVFVQMLDANHQPIGISGFVLRQGTKGFRQGLEAMTMGMRGMVQNSIYFDDVPVSSEYLLGEMGNGLQVAQDAMMFGRLGLAVISLGGMKRCAQLMLRYSSRRNVSTGRLLDNPVTLVRLRDLTAAITALETLVFTIAQLLDRGCSVPEEVYSACKISGPEFLWQAADHLVQLLGGRGYIETNIAPQILRDARLLRIFEGPTETLNMFLGSRVIQKPEELYQFLSKTLEVPEVAERLKNATAEISDRLRNKSRFGVDHTALRWAYVCTGEVATWAILLAAVKRNLKQISSESLEIAATWAELQFEQKLQLVLMGTPGEMVKSDADNITARIEDYAKKIGDLEQTLPGEDHELDQFLRQTSTVKSNKNLQETTNVAVEPKNYQPLDNQEVYNYDQIVIWIENWLAKQPGIQIEAINRQTSFADYGMDSVLAVELVQALGDWLQTSLDATSLWNFPTIESLAQYLASKTSTKEEDLETFPSGQEEAKTTTLELEKTLETQIETSIAEELVALENLFK
ncbi:AMP-binding protein [Moorena producens]|uniref:AMP-binding protein n=1 Tax=Moorena producens TaxID=1155739 RepID=UPI003C726062